MGVPQSLFEGHNKKKVSLPVLNSVREGNELI